MHSRKTRNITTNKLADAIAITAGVDKVSRFGGCTERICSATSVVTAAIVVSFSGKIKVNII
jgi:hypothetical protein